MSQYDPNNPYVQGYPQQPYDPNSVVQYGSPYPGYPVAEKRRPTSVTVLAIIGIIIAAYALICTPFSFVAYFMPTPPAGGMMAGQSKMIEVIRSDPTLLNGTLALGIAYILIGLVLLVGSIGSLGLKRWARGAMLGYATLEIAFSVSEFVFNVGVAGPRVSAALAGSGDPAMQMATKFLSIGYILALGFGLIFPACVLIFFTRPRVKAAFAGQAAPGGFPAYPQGGYPPTGSPPAHGA